MMNMMEISMKVTIIKQRVHEINIITKYYNIYKA